MDGLKVVAYTNRDAADGLKSVPYTSRLHKPGRKGLGRGLLALPYR